MTNCTKIKLEQVHRKVDLCEKKLERLAWLPYENKDWKGICSLFTYRVWINVSLSRNTEDKVATKINEFKIDHE